VVSEPAARWVRSVSSDLHYFYDLQCIQKSDQAVTRLFKVYSSAAGVKKRFHRFLQLYNMSREKLDKKVGQYLANMWTTFLCCFLGPAVYISNNDTN